ncbi:MAG: hypothetical protein GQ469_04065 [Methanosarcinales archaeon]|nr:hypothetical protein [Methanosarcinales archaeon]
MLSDAGGGSGVWYGAGRTAPAYDSGTPIVLTPWPGRGGVWCACPPPVSEGSPEFGAVGTLAGLCLWC